MRFGTCAGSLRVVADDLVNAACARLVSCGSHFYNTGAALAALHKTERNNLK